MGEENVEGHRARGAGYGPGLRVVLILPTLQCIGQSPVTWPYLDVKGAEESMAGELHPGNKARLQKGNPNQSQLSLPQHLRDHLSQCFSK